LFSFPLVNSSLLKREKDPVFRGLFGVIPSFRIFGALTPKNKSKQK
jgi:hypothetical protein